MRRIDQLFILLAAICLMAGVLMGIGMGIAHDFQLAPVHAHLNLLGFVALSIFGVVYRLYPALTQSWLATAHALTAIVTAPVFPVGIYLSITHEAPGLAIAASMVWLVSVALFLVNLLRVFVFAGASAGLAIEQPRPAAA